MWDVGTFHKLLAASATFSKLDGDFRKNVAPELTIDQLEKLTDEIEDCIHIEEYDTAVNGLIKGSVQYGHTGYLNQQLNFPIATSAIASLWSAILNQGHAVFSMSPISSVIEKRMLDWAKERLMLPAKAFGLSTGGGSLANLTALIAARNKLDAWRSWKSGGNHGVSVVVSKLAHYSIVRAASMIGIGEGKVLAVGINPAGSVDINQIRASLSNNEDGVIVCLTLGTTSTGAFDDIAGFFDAIKNLDRAKLWVHVDAAHGGSFYSCEKLSAQFAALSLCDSISWDLHKVFFQSLPLSFLFFKDRTSADFVSKHSTPYLSQETEGRYPDMHNWTLECSRAGNAMKLWLSLHSYGEEFFTEKIQHLVTLSETFYRIMSADKRIEMFSEPSTNIACFRLRATSHDLGDRMTRELLSRISAVPSWSVGYVDIEGKLYIKLCFMNPRMSIEKVLEFYECVAANIAAITRNEACEANLYL